MPEDNCGSCQALVVMVEGFIEDNATISQAEAYLTTMCDNFLPPNFAQSCDQFVMQGIPQVVEYIEKYETPQVVCTQMGLCSSKKIQATGQICSYCESAVSTVDEYLAQNQTQQYIEQQIDQLCQLLVGFTAVCEAFIADEVPQIISYLESNLSPEQVCQQIGLC